MDESDTKVTDGSASSEQPVPSEEVAQASRPAIEDAHGQDAASAATDVDEAGIAAAVEAALFSTDSPLTPAKLAQVVQATPRQVRTALKTLNDRYEQTGASFRIEEIGGGLQMLTLPQYNDVLGRLHKARSESKLSRAALETLAIVAYRQPILRADVEAIRGVASGEVLRTLMEKQLVKIVGRAEVIGRPMLYGTTRRFLDVFGLGSIEDLPRVEELRGGDKEAPQAAVEAPAAPPPTEPQQPDPPQTNPQISQITQIEKE